MSSETLTVPTTLREAIDPQATLPNVQLVPPEDYSVRKGIATDLYGIVHDGVKIGEAQIQRDSRNKEQNFSSIKIDEELRGGGFGMAAYLAGVENAHNQGDAFRTHEISQTKEAKRVWDKFISAGISEVVIVDPFVFVEGEGKYTGHVRVEPPKA